MQRGHVDDARKDLVRLVLDTNVVLDWLLFQNADVAGLEQAVADGRVEILVHGPALDELRRVLTYPQCRLDPNAQQALVTRYCSLVAVPSVPAGFGLNDLQLPSGFPHCRDPDDQHFIALAYHTRADALVTRDKQILKLRKRVRAFGVTLFTPLQMAEALRSLQIEVAC